MSASKRKKLNRQLPDSNEQTVSPKKTQNFRGSFLAASLFLTTAIWLVFGQTLDHEFINYDDNVYVYQNPWVNHGFTLPGFLRALTHPDIGLWNPPVTLSHMLACQLFGLWPGGHHGLNVLLHCFSVLLLFGLLHRLTGSVWRSAFVALLLAIHPLRVESVAWISERKDVLSGVFFLLTLCAYVRYARYPPSWTRYLPVAVFFTLGLMCKPMLVTLPFVLLLLDYWPLNRLFFKDSTLDRRILLEKIPLLVLSIIFSVATAANLTEFDSTGAMAEKFSFSARLGNGLVAYATYLGQLFYPVNLAVIYPHPGESLPAWKPILAFFLLATLTWIAFRLRKSHPYLLVGWLWNLGMLFPVSGIVQVSYHAHTDHFTYLPHIGLGISLAWTLGSVSSHWPLRRPILGLLWASTAAAWIFLARAQTAVWHDSLQLWTHTLANTSQNAIAHNSLGNALIFQGDNTQAITHFRRAVEIQPDFALAHNNLGNVLHKQGKSEEAIVHYQKALALLPKAADIHHNLAVAFDDLNRLDEAIYQVQQALEIDPAQAETYYILGDALRKKGQLDDAIACYQKTLSINPSHQQACSNLGLVLYWQGRWEQAGVYLERALEINPRDANAHNNLGAFYLQIGKEKQALLHFEASLSIHPGNPSALSNLAWILATSADASLRNGVRALQLAEQLPLSSEGQNPVFLKTLAAAYAEVGRFNDAIQTVSQAISLAETSGQDAAEARRQLKSYQAMHPYRVSPPLEFFQKVP